MLVSGGVDEKQSPWIVTRKAGTLGLRLFVECFDAVV